MPGWQRFAERHKGDDFEIIAIAIDHQGAEAARPYLETAGVTFPAVVDEEGALSARYGFLVVPNGMLVDEAGVLRWAKYGGFSIDNPDDEAVVDRFIETGEVAEVSIEQAPYQLSAPDRQRLESLLRSGQQELEAGNEDAAVARWQEALMLDPQNLTIRKQIWAVRHPERFHPVIDWDWQAVQLKAEQEREIAEGLCGPDGCPIPQKNAGV